MSSIYDNKKNAELLDGGLTSPSKVPQTPVSRPVRFKGEEPLPENTEVMQLEQSEKQSLEEINQELASYQERSSNAMALVDDIVLKNYLTKLSQLDVVPCTNMGTDDIILFKINKMVYEKDEYATDKFISVVSAMTYTNSSIYLIVDGHKSHTDFYLGIKSEDENRQKSTIAETFKSSLLGQFPGAEIEDYSFVEVDSERSRQDKLLHRITEAVSVSSCVGIPSYKNSKGEYTNANFIQGIEKFASAMHGKEYTAIILASNVPQNEISAIRRNYENIFTELSAVATKQLAYSTNESLANAISRTKGTTDTHTISVAKSVGDATSHNESTANTDSTAIGHTESESKENLLGKIGKGLAVVGGAIASVAVVAATGGAALPAVAAAGIAAVGGAGAAATAGGAMAVGGAVLGMGSKSKSKSDSITRTTSTSHTTSDGVTHTETETTTVSDAHSDSFSETDGTTSTVGTSKNFTITIQDKHILEIQKRIDKQLERIEMCESTGFWSTGAYFLSYNTDRSTAEIGATIFRSIMQGEQSGVENSAINTWYPESESKFNNIVNYIGALSHPLFLYNSPSTESKIEMLPTSLLSSKELAIMMGLPRKSVPGLPVIEHISMGKEVVRLNKSNSIGQLQLGCIFDQGIERKDNKVYLDAKSLTQHTFVTGSTGCGKSNTIYYLIKQIRNQANAPKFMVIEPAKGEYKDVFGNEHIYGTNPLKTPLLKINPFRFPEGVHVLEHIDRLVEIFNVCWPMYAAMPAVLKEAILNSYEDCGWDLYNSTNKYSNNLFPTFADLLNELVLVINTSAYSEEVKSNYQGSLVTRVKSLNNGLCKQIFSGQELGDAALFDENVIVDLSRIGSQETKSLIMGILIMRLNEYRSNSNIRHNSDLRHITILEEAHNILKRDSVEQSGEGGNVAGKSVEMISNAIAEMRTYGEGFIIVDQSPGAVDASAIRNTNTKIIMRLPDDSDRKVAGKASGMKDSQVDEIAKLPTGVAVVYQNDWEEPVLCKIGKFEDEEISFEFHPKEDNYVVVNDSAVKSEVLKLLLKGRITENIDANIDLIEDNLVKSTLSTFNKIAIFNSVDEYKKSGKLDLWNDNQFEQLSRLVTEILSAKSEVMKYADSASSFDQLTDKLEQFIKNVVPEIPNELTLVASQCLMRDYSLANDVQKRIYSAWYQSIRNNKMT